MTNNEVMFGSYHFPKLGAFCPKCYRTAIIGDIFLNTKIVYDAYGRAPKININPSYAMNMHPDTQHIRNFIRIQCPNCSRNMIVVDEAIIGYISDLNKSGLFTKSSGVGRSVDDPPFVKFTMSESWFFELLNMIAEAKDLSLSDIDKSPPSNNMCFHVKYGSCRVELLRLEFNVFESTIYPKNYPSSGKDYSEEEIKNFWTGVGLFRTMACDAVNAWKCSASNAKNTKEFVESINIRKSIKSLMDAAQLETSGRVTLRDVIYQDELENMKESCLY